MARPIDPRPVADRLAAMPSHALRSRTVIALVFATAAWTTACGGPPPAPTGHPFSADDRRTFEDGVDFVADPTALEGRWRQEWSDDLQARIGAADAVAKVTVHTLRTDVDPGRRTTYRLIVGVDERLLGELPSELTLTSAEDEEGYRTIEGNDRRLLQQPFVLFLKWEQVTPDAEAAPHFHLSPATDAVAQRVAYLLERRRGVEREHPVRRVVVHHN